MIKSYKIGLAIPDSEKPDAYFSLKLKSIFHSEKCIYNSAKKVILISGFEENLGSLVKCLFKIKVLNKYLEWSFGDNHLIILGKKPESEEGFLDSLWFIHSLEEKAIRARGFVHYISPNVSLAELKNNIGYQHPSYVRSVSQTAPRNAFYNGHNYIFDWLKSKNIVEKLGNMLFVQGDFSLILDKSTFSLEEINFFVRKKRELDTQGIATKIGDAEYLLQRGHQGDIVPDVQIKESLVKFEVGTIISAQTALNRICIYQDGKTLNIYDNKTPNILFIYKDKFYKIEMNGEKKRLK